MTERQEVIKILEHMIVVHKRLIGIDEKEGDILGKAFIFKRIHALEYAVNSLKTDEAYQLEYENFTQNVVISSDKEVENSLLGFCQQIIQKHDCGGKADE